MQEPLNGRPHPLSAEALQHTEPIDRCQLCGSAARDLKFRDGPFEVLTCRDCGLVYVTPRLLGDVLRDVYNEEYWKSDNPKMRGYADYAREAALYLKTFEKRMALVQQWLPARARVLDAAAAMNYQPASFDLITLWDVIEHVPNPQAVLQKIRELLAPHGKLLLETQNVASRWARLLGPRWHHYKHHEHLYHFSPATITRLLGDCGFAVQRIGSAYAGKYVSFGFLAERAGRLGRIPGLLAKPLSLLRGANLYVNPHDEIIVVATPA